MARCNFGLLLVLLLVSASSAQSQPQSDPQAISLASQSIGKLTGGSVISDAALTGSATWSGESHPETGTITLLASGTGESRMNLTLPTGKRTEIRDASTGVVQGEWIAEGGTSGPFAFHNCLTDAVWFFPPLGSLAAGPNVVLTYIGQETKNEVAVQHIHSYVYQPNPSGARSSLQPLSAMDYFLDATTLLPVAITFNAHPDNSVSTNLLVEVDFSDYQPIGGVIIPTHIQRSLQGNVLLDISISNASFNTGLPISDFTVN